MEKLDKDRSRWLLLASQRPSLLHELATLVPVTYALTHKRSVHNINAVGLSNLIFANDEERVCPLGKGALAFANLVWFEHFGRYYRGLRSIEDAIAHLFCQWTEPGTQVVFATPYFGTWTKRDAEIIYRIYGMEVALIFNEKVDLMDIG
jgi:hypothetical protein